MDKSEKFKGGYGTFYIVTILLSLVLFWEISKNGLQKNVQYGSLWVLAGIVFTFLMAYFTLTKITSDKNLVNTTPLERGFKIDIFSITMIDRTPVFVFKKWGSRLQIHFKNEYSDNDWRTIREANYNVKTIKALLKRLKEINPSIKLHPQYQDLIDGKIEDDSSFKSDEIEGEIEK